jgi:Reverse transcriptase (RNA-dependent DNA polymerase)
VGEKDAGSQPIPKAHWVRVQFALTVPTMIDRAMQALHLFALDPVAETTADKNSYGFRQQRSCADAIEQSFNALNSATTLWVLEGDIRSCFDKIPHDWLLAHQIPLSRPLRIDPLQNTGFDLPRRFTVAFLWHSHLCRDVAPAKPLLAELQNAVCLNRLLAPRGGRICA